MLRYLRLYLLFFKNCLTREMEYRLNFLALSVMNLLWLGMVFVSLTWLFGQIDGIAGWNREQVFLLAATELLFYDLTEIFIRDNSRRFSDLIRHGDLDFVLLRPVSARFFVSTRYFDFSHFSRLFITIPLIFSFAQSLKIGFGLNYLNALVLFASGLAIFYSLFFILTTLNFWLTRFFNLDDIQAQLIETARYPLDIFRNELKLVFTHLLPVAFIATFPVLALFGQIGLAWSVYGLILAVVFFLVSQLLWRFALKNYSSASS
jgi:ABC-2 type transport system permease protein